MSEWILLLWFAGAVNSNHAYGLTAVPGFPNEELCLLAGRDFMLRAQSYLNPSFLCVMRTPK